ncbi:MAG: hypothetical protein A4S09_05125 [Proteobacteria bacterium SG_bin7]|nr:MAG: hypothetical protein A4S09_05125 [Proteobacteria bacterium SG_bin7]
MARISLIFKYSLLVGSLLTLSHCTFRIPATDVPKPDQQNIEKSFFVNSSGKPKTFMCGWASINEVGVVSEYNQIHNAAITNHCNIQFFITETNLLGKMINPSFPNDPGRWQTAVKIPIKSHYYFEREKDQNGRDTTRFVENSSRSHWSARPYIKLDLAGISILKSDFGLLGFDPEQGGAVAQQINAVDDIEWDTKNGFLGFTVQASAPKYGSENQGLFRINFLEFEHNTRFKKTRTNDRNYTYFNALHIMGEKVDGVYPLLYAAHWDLSKTHEVYLNGFPPEYVDIAAEVVDEWNELFASVPGLMPKGHKPFVLNKSKSKHIFDLRKTAITWTSDVKISGAPASPLGIGEVVADVRNGEILWASINLYGGTLINSIKAVSPVSSTGFTNNNNFADFIFNSKLIPSSLSLPSGVLPFSLATGETSLQNFAEKLRPFVDTALYNSKLAEAEKSVEKIDKASVLNTIRSELQSRFLPENMVKHIMSGLQAEIAKKSFETNSFFASDSYRKRLVEMLPKSNLKAKDEKSENEYSNNSFLHLLHPKTFDIDRTVQDVAPGWASAISALKKDHNLAVRSIVKELITHEYGHIMGLGHQFKENILPHPDKVPHEIYESLARKATPEGHFTNFTSVMGYRNPRTEIADDYKNIKPGPQDRLVVAFLYGQKYATFKKGDTDFRFVNMPAEGTGIIPENDPKDPEYKTSYFPQCNDIDASLSLDPYCNRWDTGNTARQIVENYLVELRDLTPTLFSLTDVRGGNADAAEAQLWKKSIGTFGRVRVFYDYMRHKFKKQFDRVKKNEKALYAFSKACSSEREVSEWDEIFAEEPELKELCAVNRAVLNEIIKNVGLNTSDYTKMDSDNRYVPGGISGGDAGRDFGRAYGTWVELNGLIIKLASTLALVTPFPWVQLGNSMMGIPTYNTPDERYVYSSLYPVEYTKAISNVIKRNLHFATLNPNERTRMGQAAFALSGLLQLGQYNNDKNFFGTQYLEKINSQTKFNLSIVAIILNGYKKDGKVDRVDRFSGQVFDFQADKSIPLSSDVYLLPEGQVIAKSEDMFLFPITNFQLFSDTSGYVVAYKIDYYKDDNQLSKVSVKTELKDLYDQLLSNCIDEKKNGLSSFFNKTEPKFEGFYMPTDLLKDSVEKGKLFRESINSAFEEYRKSKGVSHEVCSEAIRGLGLIISSAAVVSGNWIPEIRFYLQN